MLPCCDGEIKLYMKAFWVQMIDLDLFFQYLKGSWHGNQFCGKSVAKLPTLPALIVL